MIDRWEVQPGKWEYRDTLEACFVFELWSADQMAGDVASIDSFILDARTPDVVRFELLEQRHNAFEAFKSGDFDLSKAIVSSMWNCCRFNGLAIAAAPIARTGKRVKDAAKKGHEAVHGDSATKEARWRKYCSDYAETAKAHRRWAKKSILADVAEKNGVSEKTVRRAMDRLAAWGDDK